MTKVIDIAKKYPKINLPTECPLCGSQLVINDTWSRISCPNKNCYTYMHDRITKYLSIMGVMHIAGAIIDTLMDEGFLTDIPDLYEINWNKVAKLDGFGKTSTEKYKREIENHRTATVAQFLSGFNIAGMGETQISKMIEDAPLEKVLKMKPSKFITVGIREKTATKFYEGLKELKDVIVQTAKYITFEEPEETEQESDLLDGLSFCFTGAIEGYTRSQLETLVVQNGGTVSSVKKGLSYLVTDDADSGSSKNVKAKQLGIKVISSKEFFNMIK